MTVRLDITEASASPLQPNGTSAEGSLPPAVLSEPLLTADDAVTLLRVRRSTVYELARTRRLPHVGVGRRILFCGQTSPPGSRRTAPCAAGTAARHPDQSHSGTTPPVPFD